ncbi:lipoprotein LpqH [Mycobacterium sp. 050134]|uniref:lipoprotein LpqH n=1 Tax=Mycobacterium sp. 050134 TaxID=3096111 RepID=UPI002EDAE2EE
MRHGIVVSVAGVALVVAGCAGCSSNKSNTGASSPPPAAPPQVVVDGKNLNVTGAVTCTPAGNNINIGIGDVANGVGAVVSKDNPPIVHAVGLGTVDGIILGFSDAAQGQGGNAGAAASGNSLQIKGTATGADTSNPQQPKPVTKPFEMDLTCP